MAKAGLRKWVKEKWVDIDFIPEDNKKELSRTRPRDCFLLGLQRNIVLFIVSFVIN